LLSLPEAEHLRSPLYASAVKAWAFTAARCQLIEEWIGDQPPVDAKGPLPALEQLRLWRTSERNLRRDLGLDPVTHAKLAKDLAVTRAVSGGQLNLTANLERGRAVLEAADPFALTAGEEQSDAAG
jgi:hypothetical protein